jgi:hypothetical protein
VRLRKVNGIRHVFSMKALELDKGIYFGVGSIVSIYITISFYVEVGMG